MEDNLVMMKDIEEIVEKAPDENASEEEFEKFYNENKDILDLMGGVEFFGNILQMEEEQFKKLEPSFVQIFTESLHESATREQLRALINSQNTNFEELNLNYALLLRAVDDLEDYSQPKKDFLKKIIAIMLDTLQEFDDWTTKLIKIPCELSEGVKLPTYAHDGDAGLDIYAPKEYIINPGETVIIPTGIKCAIPKGYAILIQPRSGQSVKTKLRVANTPGLIDSGYRDEIGVIVENIEPPIKDITYEFGDDGEIHIKSILHGASYTIGEGQRFAQMRLVEAPTAAFFEVENVGGLGIDRKGGFGSTGI